MALRIGHEQAARFPLCMHVEGDPWQALSRLSLPVPASLHAYVEPRTPEYLSTQEAFARDDSRLRQCVC